MQNNFCMNIEQVQCTRIQLHTFQDRNRSTTTCKNYHMNFRLSKFVFRFLVTQFDDNFSFHNSIIGNNVAILLIFAILPCFGWFLGRPDFLIFAIQHFGTQKMVTLLYIQVFHPLSLHLVKLQLLYQKIEFWKIVVEVLMW